LYIHFTEYSVFSVFHLSGIFERKRTNEMFMQQKKKKKKKGPPIVGGVNRKKKKKNKREKRKKGMWRGLKRFPFRSPGEIQKKKKKKNFQFNFFL